MNEGKEPEGAGTAGKAAGATHAFERRIPEGDGQLRLVCRDCGFIAYENPKVVVGSVCRWEGKILLCRRAINPRSGFWTLPAGYMELNETSLEGAQREAWEEARASIEIERLLAVYNIPRLSQVQLIYVARLLSPAVEAGPESAEVGAVRLVGDPLAGPRLPLGALGPGALPRRRGGGALPRADESRRGRLGNFSIRGEERGRISSSVPGYRLSRSCRVRRSRLSLKRLHP